MSSNELTLAQTKLTEQQVKNEKETHCVLMLNAYSDAMKNSYSEHERQLLHNLRASVFLELKELRGVHH
jgi:hypothetical protein